MDKNAYGIDLGTNNIKVYSLTTDTVMVQKNMIAIENKKDLFAYGDSAYEMYEKTPSNIEISFPLTNGVISDLLNMQMLVRYFLTDLQDGTLKPADFVIAVPWDITDVEKRAFYDLLKDSGVKAKKIQYVDKAVADGLGMGIDVKSSQGVMVVNVGFESTEISILSLGGIVLSRMIKVGGQKFDESIRGVIRKEFNLLIGGKTAEIVKNTLKDLEKQNSPATVYGRDIVTGLPVERKIPTDLVVDSLEENFNTIIENVKVILEKTPPELAADIYRHGIYLTGGASQVSHLVERIADGTGLKVNVTDDPIATVAAGLGSILKNENYHSVAYSVEGMSK